MLLSRTTWRPGPIENTTIDRGTLGSTIVRAGVKTDNLVYIAHNYDIGANSLVIAGAVICGSVKMGPRCWIAPQACISDGITVGSDFSHWESGPSQLRQC
jgi:UDP-3-O-[3-hydroxymyristoyl] glucosamine N-acyltransferase